MNLTIRLLVTTTLLLASGCAKTDWIDRTLVTVDVTGTWEGTFFGAATSLDFQFELEQQGSTVKGFMRLGAGRSQNPMGARDGPIVGTVTGDVFSFTQTVGRAAGEMKVVSDDQMEGRGAIGDANTRLILRRVAHPSSQEQSSR